MEYNLQLLLSPIIIIIIIIIYITYLNNMVLVLHWVPAMLVIYSAHEMAYISLTIPKWTQWILWSIFWQWQKKGLQGGLTSFNISTPDKTCKYKKYIYI